MKPIQMISILLLCGATALAQPAPAPQQWGTIFGRIVYDGTPPQPAMMPTKGKTAPNGPKEIAEESLVVGQNGGLANVFVFLRSKPSAIHPGYTKSEPQKIQFGAKNYCFVPHALGIWTQDTLLFKNHDPFGVNFNFTSAVQNHGGLIANSEKIERQFQFSESLPRPVVCNIYPWMSAQLLVRDNPYFCVTDERGIFCIPNLPANGELEFQFWHERVGYLRNIKSDVAAFTTNDKGRLSTKLMQPVTDLGEFRIEPAILQGKE